MLPGPGDRNINIEASWSFELKHADQKLEVAFQELIPSDIWPSGGCTPPREGGGRKFLGFPAIRLYVYRGSWGEEKAGFGAQPRRKMRPDCQGQGIGTSTLKHLGASKLKHADQKLEVAFQELIPNGIWPSGGCLIPRGGVSGKSWVPRLFVYMFIGALGAKKKQGSGSSPEGK